MAICETKLFCAGSSRSNTVRVIFSIDYMCSRLKNHLDFGYIHLLRCIFHCDNFGMVYLTNPTFLFDHSSAGNDI